MRSRQASFAGRIFQSVADVARVKASDLSVEQPTKFEYWCQFKDGKANRLDDFTRSLGQSGSGNPMRTEAPLTFKFESRNSKYQGQYEGYQKMECQICF